MLQVKNLTVRFGDRQVVDDISFELLRGETLALVGESGSGKSVTSLTLMGLQPTAAHISGQYSLLQNEEIAALEKLTSRQWQQVRGSRISMVFQEPMSALNPVMKVGKQLAESIAANGKYANLKEETLAWMARVQLPSPAEMYHKYPHQLSGGQKQRIMIAMAMCGYPEVLIADEPTTALDSTVQAEVLALMRQLQQRYHTAILFITHNLAVARLMANTIAVMYQGKIVEQGRAETVLSAPAHAYTKALLACRPTPAAKGQPLPTIAQILGSATFPAARNTLHHTYTDLATPALEARNLTIRFSDKSSSSSSSSNAGFFTAVDDVSFTLHTQEVLGLVGESGCGKSTLARALIGLQHIQSGSLSIMGSQDMAQATQAEWKPRRRDIQMVFQDPYSSLNPRLRVGEMLKETLLLHSVVPAASLEEEVSRLLAIVELPPDSSRKYPHEFSGGQRQRLGIARALSLRPRLLICDESVAALDVSVQAGILNLLRRLQQQQQLSLLFISHDLAVVHYLCDRVMVMQKGKIVETGAAGKILTHPETEYARQLVAALIA